MGFALTEQTPWRFQLCRRYRYSLVLLSRIRIFPALNSTRLFPGRIYGLADQHRGICARARRELLRAAVIHLRGVEIAGLIDAESVYTPEAAGEIAPGAPGVQQVALLIVLQHLRGAAIEGPQVAVRAHVDQVDIRRVFAHAEFILVFAIIVEYLDAVVAAVVHENALRHRIDRDAVHVIPIAGALLGLGTFLA